MIVFFPIATFFLLASITRLAFWIIIIAVPVILVLPFYYFARKILGLDNDSNEFEQKTNKIDLEQLADDEESDNIDLSNNPNLKKSNKPKTPWNDPFNPDDIE